MKIRCTLDGLLLDATMRPDGTALVACDGDEAFVLEAVEALYYELVSATTDEIVALEQARYRLLRIAADFERSVS
jgi:hypothetical protein